MVSTTLSYSFRLSTDLPLIYVEFWLRSHVSFWSLWLATISGEPVRDSLCRRKSQTQNGTKMSDGWENALNGFARGKKYIFFGAISFANNSEISYHSDKKHMQLFVVHRKYIPRSYKGTLPPKTLTPTLSSTTSLTDMVRSEPET